MNHAHILPLPPAQTLYSPAQIDRAFSDSLVVLESLRSALTPWELAAGIVAETSWTAQQRSHTSSAWGAIAVAQRARLVAVLGEVTAIDRASAAVSADRHAPALTHQRAMLQLLASAAATSPT